MKRILSILLLALMLAFPTVEIAPQAASATYVLNTNTKKFHRPSCSSVKQMKEKNRQDTTMSYDEVISRGYKPCKNCNPTPESGAAAAGTSKSAADAVKTSARSAVSEGSGGSAGQTTKAQESGITYVVNTNTKKFHRPSCSSVDSMKSKNRWDCEESREQLINQGYQPCKRCKP